MTVAGITRRIPWWVAVFALGLATRLGFLWLADGPLVFGHERVYFGKALWIAEHPHPLSFVLGSDAWRSWGGSYWTQPPLYQLFVAAFFALVGASLVGLQALQSLMGALTAVAVGQLGRQVDPGRGAWAGVVYAVYWPAVVMASNPMTETLHTPLLAFSLVLLARGASRPGLAWTAAGGFMLGLSALARSVSVAFLPVAALCQLRWRGLRRGMAAGAVVMAAGAAAILPWTARNAYLTGDFVLIDTVSIYNLWQDNAFVNEDRAARQERSLYEQPTPAARRARALDLTWRNVTRSPDVLPLKIWDGLRYFLRPDGLDNLLRVEYPHPPWLHAAWLILGDAMLLAALPPFLVFAWAGRQSPARTLLLLWSGYYLFLLVVVYHTQLRYRSAWVPALLAGAAGGLATLATGGRRGARLALALGLALVGAIVSPYVAPAWRAARAAAALIEARAALARGQQVEAHRVAQAAAARDHRSVRPLLTYGRLLAASGRAAEAVEAYRQAEARRPEHWVAPLVLPQLLREAGRWEDAERALPRADAVAASFDAWWALEVAWRQLPPPRTDEIRLGRGDYGAVRGFLDRRRDHRWSCRRAFLRLVPTRAASSYEVTLDMGSPAPAPRPDPVITVRATGSPPVRLRLGAEVRSYRLRARLEAGQPLLVALEAPTWNRVGEPPEQGVRVDRMRVTPTLEAGLMAGAPAQTGRD